MTLEDYKSILHSATAITKDMITEIVELLPDTMNHNINVGMFPTMGTVKYTPEVIMVIESAIDVIKNNDDNKRCELMEKEFAKLNKDNVNNLIQAVMTVRLAGRFDTPLDVLKDNIGVTTIFDDLSGYEDYVNDIIKSEWLSRTFDELCKNGWESVKIISKQNVDNLVRFISIINKLSNSIIDETI